MITRQFITDIATKYQTTEGNVAREYCQHLFLSYFYKKPKSEKVLFKGGTALRLIFKSPRFSEDLDLKLKEIDEKEKMIDRQISELEGDMKEIKDSEALEVEIEKTCKLYQQKIDNPPFELKKYIVFKWVEEININDDGSLKIRVRIPEGDAAWAKKEDMVYVTNEGLSGATALNIGLKFEEVIMP